MTNVHIQPPICTDRALELSWKDSNIKYLDHLGNSDIAFFITHVPTPHLDDVHSIFGKVSLGQDVVDAIAQDDVMTTIVIEGDSASLLAAQKEHVDEWNRILDGR